MRCVCERVFRTCRCLGLPSVQSTRRRCTLQRLDRKFTVPSLSAACCCCKVTEWSEWRHTIGLSLPWSTVRLSSIYIDAQVCASTLVAAAAVYIKLHVDTTCPCRVPCSSQTYHPSALVLSSKNIMSSRTMRAGCAQSIRCCTQTPYCNANEVPLTSHNLQRILSLIVAMLLAYEAQGFR
jgi:hypothetical protein